jgi:hypothetical protein
MEGRKETVMSKLKRFAGVALSALLLFGFAACTVEQEEEGNLPEYEIEQTEEGELPEYDVDAADVEIGTEEKTITVPDVDIEPSEEDQEDDGM